MPAFRTWSQVTLIHSIHITVHTQFAIHVHNVSSLILPCLELYTCMLVMSDEHNRTTEYSIIEKFPTQVNHVVQNLNVRPKREKKYIIDHTQNNTGPLRKFGQEPYRAKMSIQGEVRHVD